MKSVRMFFCFALLVLASCGYEVTSKDFCTGSSCSSFTYGGQKYMTVTIGTQVWMAENLNYEVSGSKCYDDKSYNCTIYGRLYRWAAAMNLPSSCNSSGCFGQISAKHQGICPTGWHIPSDNDWDVLMNYVGGSSTAGRKLRATSGWRDGGNGSDTYSFAALPGGYGRSDGNFSRIGDLGIWWSACEGSAYYYWYMLYDNEYAIWNNDYYGTDLFSVRCLQD